MASNYNVYPLKKSTTWTMSSADSKGELLVHPAMSTAPERPPQRGRGFSLRDSIAVQPMAQTLGNVLNYILPYSNHKNSPNHSNSTRGLATGSSGYAEIDKFLQKIQNTPQRTANKPSQTWRASSLPPTPSIRSGSLLLPLSSHCNATKFLLPDRKSQLQELSVEMHILRAKSSWLVRDYQSMFEAATTALQLSSDLGHHAYTAKVCLYIAVACFGLKDFDGGAYYLAAAEACRGVFREGELIEWVRDEGKIFERHEAMRGDPGTSSTGRHTQTGAAEHRARSVSIEAPPVPGKSWYPWPRSISLTSPGLVGSSGPSVERGGAVRAERHNSARILVSRVSSVSFEGNAGQPLGAELELLLEEEEEVEEEEEGEED